MNHFHSSEISTVPTLGDLRLLEAAARVGLEVTKRELWEQRGGTYERSTEVSLDLYATMRRAAALSGISGGERGSDVISDDGWIRAERIILDRFAGRDGLAATWAA